MKERVHSCKTVGIRGGVLVLLEGGGGGGA